MYALVLSEYACADVDTGRVMRMLLLHDIVEIEVGDFPIHGGVSSELQAEQESRAAAHLFGLPPQAQRNEFLGLWLSSSRHRQRTQGLPRRSIASSLS